MTRETIRVMKFGGTSVGDAACIRRAAEIVAAASSDAAVVAVVSAMGGVTNRLIEAAQSSATGDRGPGVEIAEALGKQHRATIEDLVSNDDRRAKLVAEIEKIIEHVTGLCYGTALLRELTPRVLDEIVSTGERLSARLLASALCELGLKGVAVEATELIVTDNASGRAEPLMAQTRERATVRLLPLLEDDAVPVVTGFIGATAGGMLTTLGRGGSDYSATILGAALDATEVIIWTDVDGVLTADPRLVPEARTLREISRRNDLEPRLLRLVIQLRGV